MLFDLIAMLDFLSPFKTLQNPWLACVVFIIATCLTIRSIYKCVVSQGKGKENSLKLRFLTHNRSPLESTIVPPPASPISKKMRYSRNARRAKAKKLLSKSETPAIQKTRQPYEIFLVLDLEGTCKLGTDFNYPNEIIEFPVSVLKWVDRDEDGAATTLEVIDEFRTFVRPSWRPTLSEFCTELTGITQEQVDAAPPFTEVLVKLEAFLVKHGLIEEGTRKRLKRFCWCSDGPWDIRDFLVKQCFISQAPMPVWIQGDVLDVRCAVLQWMNSDPTLATKGPATHLARGTARPSLNISAQLKVLGLPAFEGRQHSGIDDTRNIAKIVTELARRGVHLLPNTTIYPGRRWSWMGKYGQVLEDGLP